MAAKRTAAKAGFKFFRAAPAKGKLAKGAFRLGRRRAIRTPAGTAVLYGQALVGNQQARKDLRGAYTSARKAYARTADWRGRPDIGALFEDRKARKETGKALSSLREALKVAEPGRSRRAGRVLSSPWSRWLGQAPRSPSTRTSAQRLSPLSPGPTQAMEARPLMRAGPPTQTGLRPGLPSEAGAVRDERVETRGFRAPTVPDRTGVGVSLSRVTTTIGATNGK